MTYPSINREQKILEILQKQRSVSIQELVDELGVSNMTIHRDLNKLVEAGYIQKKHGGVTLDTKTTNIQSHSCSMCHKSSSGRVTFIVQLENGEKKFACCAHCGLMIHSETKKVKQSLTTDYLYGHMVSANQATYVVGSELTICCVPSILSFSTQEDAEKFRRGFGGKVVDIEKAMEYLK